MPSENEQYRRYGPNNDWLKNYNTETKQNIGSQYIQYIIKIN